MKLSGEVVSKLKGSNAAQARLMKEFNVSGQAIVRWINENAKNGNLTKVVAVKAIAEEFGMSEEMVLENER